MAKKMLVMYDISGTVVVDRLSSPTTFTSQLHPDGHLLTFFPNADGTVVTLNGGNTEMQGVSTVRHTKIYRTVQSAE